jgi:hypothetical protein
VLRIYRWLSKGWVSRHDSFLVDARKVLLSSVYSTLGTNCFRNLRLSVDKILQGVEFHEEAILHMLSESHRTQTSVPGQAISIFIQAYYDSECISFVWKGNGEWVVSVKTADVKETNLERKSVFIFFRLRRNVLSV